MFHPIVVSIKRRIDLQIDILRRIQPLVFRIRYPVAVVFVVAVSCVIVYEDALGSISVSLVQDFVQARARIEHEVLETVEFHRIAKQWVWARRR